MAFELTRETVGAWLVERRLASAGEALEVAELPGGISATVLAVRGPTVSLVVKQALPQLRVADDWRAAQTRTETEAEVMSLCASLTPGAVPVVVALDAVAHVVAMELIEGAENWQASIAGGVVQPALGSWAGEVLGTWHRETHPGSDLPAALADLESFEQQRLRPFHETVMARRPELAAAIAPYRDALRSERRCLVHGDYAMKNMLVGPSGRWVLDFEVAHRGNPIFDLAFFLSFVVLSAIRWPHLTTDLRELADGFLGAYRAASPFDPDNAALAGHTACLVLARTDGKSPALFLDGPSSAAAREVGDTMLGAPERGVWNWRY
jgi:5-methylthioribose kinase